MIASSMLVLLALSSAGQAPGSQTPSEAPRGLYLYDQPRQQIRQNVFCKLEGATKLVCWVGEVSIKPPFKIDPSKAPPAERAEWEKLKTESDGACSIGSIGYETQFELKDGAFKKSSTTGSGPCAITVDQEWRREGDGTWRFTRRESEGKACTDAQRSKGVTFTESTKVFAPSGRALPLPQVCKTLDTADLAERELGDAVTKKR